MRARFPFFTALVLGGLLWFPTPSQGQTPDFPTESWSLERCLEHALTHNLSLQQAQLGLERGDIGLLAAKGAFLPNLNASMSYGVNIGQRIDPFTNTFATNAVQSSNYGLSSGVTLFNGFQNHLNLRRARLGLDLAQANVEIAQNNVALTVASAYLNILFQEEFLRIANLNAEATSRQVDRVEKLVAAGAAAESDLYDVKAQQAADLSAVVNAENAVQLATLNLAQLLQLDADDAERIEVVAPAEGMLQASTMPSSADAAVAFALSQFPDMRAAELQVTDAYLGLDLAKAARYPSIRGSYSTGSGYSGNRQEAVIEPIYTDFTIPTNTQGISLTVPVETSPGVYETMSFQDQLSNNINQSIFFSMSIPLFNNFGIASGVKRAEVDVLAAQLSKDQTAQALTQSVESAWADARAAKRTFEANSDALDAAELAMTNAEARFEAGAISALEYADARTRVDNARINALRTRYDYVFKTRILDFYMGRPLSL